MSERARVSEGAQWSEGSSAKQANVLVVRANGGANGSIPYASISYASYPMRRFHMLPTLCVNIYVDCGA